MKHIVHSKFGGSVLVILAFAICLKTNTILPTSWDWYGFVTNLIAGITFFLVGCVLPEYREKRFLSRKSALQLMAFFLWLAICGLYRVEIVKDMQESVSWFRDSMMYGGVIVTFASYFLAICLIRGFRAQPEYEVSPDKPN